MRDHCSGGNVLYFDCINAYSLVLQDVSMKGNWIKGIRVSLHYFLQLHVNLQLSQIKSLIKNKNNYV